MAEERAQRRLAAILAADVVGYSRLMEQDEAGTLAALKARRRDVLQPLVTRHEGRIFKTTGDGVLVEFGSAVNAVECAVELQQGMAAANAAQPDSGPILLRIGVNLGDVMVEGSDLYGDGVNIAARLEALAEPGGVLVSHAVFSHVRGKVRSGFEDIGEQGLKNITEPVRIYRASPSSSFGAAPAASQGAAVPKPTIAVLPFANLSGDQEQGYFSDGITEDIITDLSRWHELGVQSRSASFRYRGAAADLGRVARELNVRYIVEGSIRRLGERIRITAQLIDTETGSHIWAERFDRNVAEVFTVQDEVVRTIVSTLVGRVQAADAERARRKPPASLAAYECVVRGNALPWDDVKGAAEATRLFEKAIEIDPGYGYAYALLAVMRWRRWFNDLGGSNAALDEAYELANRAIQLASNQSVCFNNLSWICLLRRSFDLAEQHMQRAIEINPANQWHMASLGNVFSYVGRAEEAIIWLKRAKKIDSYFDPPWYWHSLGQAHMVLRQYKEAVREFERAPVRPFWVCAYLAGCHARLANMDRASMLVAECLEKKPDFTISRWMAKEPFRDPADAAHLAECLRAAGFVE